MVRLDANQTRSGLLKEATSQYWPSHYNKHSYPNYALTETSLVGWATSHRGSILASHPAAPGSILGVPKNFSLNFAEIY